MTLVTGLPSNSMRRTRFRWSAHTAPSSVFSGRAGVRTTEEAAPAVGTRRPGGASRRGCSLVFSFRSGSTKAKGVLVCLKRKDPRKEITGNSLDPVTRLWYRLMTDSLMELMSASLRGRFLRLVAISWRIRPGRGRLAKRREHRVKHESHYCLWIVLKSKCGVEKMEIIK